MVYVSSGRSRFSPQKLGDILTVSRRNNIASGVTGILLYRGGNLMRVLIRASPGADLLVVGSRGRGGFTGMLLGSVSEHVIAHAACPVLVIRHGAATTR